MTFMKTQALSLEHVSDIMADTDILIREFGKQLCTWSQICSGGQGWCHAHGMEVSSRTYIMQMMICV